jgi:hypothetical protein
MNILTPMGEGQNTAAYAFSIASYFQTLDAGWFCPSWGVGFWPSVMVGMVYSIKPVDSYVQEVSTRRMAEREK